MYPKWVARSVNGNLDDNLRSDSWCCFFYPHPAITIGEIVVGTREPALDRMKAVSGYSPEGRSSVVFFFPLLSLSWAVQIVFVFCFCFPLKTPKGVVLERSYPFLFLPLEVLALRHLPRWQ